MKPSYDVMTSKQDSYDAMKPSYDAMTSKQDSYDPTYPSYDPTYPSYEPKNKKPKLLPETTKVCCHYHKKYRPQKEMIKEQLENDKIIWICSVNNQCKIATIM
jgi:hypothetical protein